MIKAYVIMSTMAVTSMCVITLVSTQVHSIRFSPFLVLRNSYHSNVLKKNSKNGSDITKKL